MFLRSLTLRGFKSFAAKTTLEFTQGVSVIVGPNGSGKSNIVDAIAWVLGEQGPRSLRGAQMADVIFAGSPARPPLGLASVSMVIDNSAGLIPVPASEVEISRTVYRSGESEYRLGGRPCRLLDIQELLSDTGIGRALHTIIGQGQLDAVLAARPEERRQFVEEAAGIAKHRRRRERAERRLAGLEGDLLRIQDLLSELKRQLKPLKQQAELAERHEALTKEATELALRLSAARLRELYRDRERRRPAWERAEGGQAAARARLAELDGEIAALEEDRARAESSQREAEDIRTEAVRSKSEAEGRLRLAVRDEARARERLSAAANRSGRLFALEEELDRTEGALVDVRRAAEQRERELEEAERAFRRAEQARQDAEGERRRLSEEAAARKAEAEALGRTLSGHEAERSRLSAIQADLRGQLGAAQARSAELAAEVERLDALETPLSGEQAAIERERIELARRLAELDARGEGLRARRDALEARRAELSESPGAAFARRHGGRAIGLLRDLIEAPKDIRAALDAALGPFADAVVYSGEAEALADAAAGEGAGVTLASAEGAESPPPSIPFERSLLDAVRPEPRVRLLAGRLLEETYLVRSLAEAAAKHRVHPGARFVTPEGTMVGPLFVRTSRGQDERMEQVRREAAAIDREMGAVHRELREGRARLAEISARAEVVGTELDGADRLITAAAEQMADLEKELATLRTEEQLVRERHASVEAAASGARDALGRAPLPVPEPPGVPPFAEPPIQLRVEVEALRRERSRLEAGVARARREIEALDGEDPGELREAVRAAEQVRAAAEEDVRKAEEDLAGAVTAHGGATDTARAIQDRHAQASRAWRVEAAAVERLRQEHEEEDRERHDLDRRIADAERLLAEGHGADPSEAVEGLSEEETLGELQRRSDLVARRMGLVGRVNLLATGELESVQQRYDFVRRELEDVKGARTNLQGIIREVDERVAELFAAAFEDVAREFSALFRLMFPGGEGRLTLTDPADLLGSGIEVEARPGRGRVKRLSLLSGGERSLAALAFLFAIFRARPSPFYLMDEVEAALDDINLHRFLEVVRAFAQDSQVLLVTHQKRSMEMADVLYGVSMGGDGASTVISQRLLEVAVG